MSTLNSKSADSLRQRAVDATSQATKSVVHLSGVLWETYHNDVMVGGLPTPLWEAWGHTTWFEYVEHELGIHQSTAAAYRRIHEIFEIELEGKWDKNLCASFTKMKALVRVVTKTNVNSWLKKAAKMGCCQLDEEINNALFGKVRVHAVHTFLTTVTKKELREINKVLAIARESFPETERRGAVLVKVLEEWNNIHSRTRRAKSVKRSAA